VTQVVAAELQLEPVGGGLPVRWRHHAGVVDQDVDRTVLADQGGAQRGDGPQRGQVEVPQGQHGLRVPLLDLRDRRLAFVTVADGHDDLGTRGGQAGRQDQSDAVAGAGDDGKLPGKVGNGDVRSCACHASSSLFSVDSLERECDSRLRLIREAIHGLSIRGCPDRARAAKGDRQSEAAVRRRW